MRQTLFRIPLDGPWSLGPLGEWPGFGFGIVLGLWILAGVYWLVRHRRALRPNFDTASAAAMWIAVAAVIVAIPRLASSLGGTTAAIESATAAIERNPRAIEARLQRAEAHRARREFARAVDDLRQAVAIDESSIAGHTRLAWMLATCPDATLRDGAQAVEHAARACELSEYRGAHSLDALAAAQAESGQYDQAVKTAELAAAAAWRSPEPSDRDLVPAIRERLQKYQRGVPYRDPTGGRSVPVYGYGFMLFLGFLAAGWAATRRAALVGISSDVIWDLAMWTFFAGIAGARIYYCVQYADRVFYHKVGDRYELKDPAGLITSALNLPDGGLVLYGGLLLGAATYFIFCRVRRQNPLLLADIVIPSVFIGVALGRVGCFLNGCCFGDRCTLPWAVEFPLGSVPDATLVGRGFIGADQPTSLPLHPTQLYSVIDAAVLALLTHAYFRYRHRNGSVLALGLLTYPVTRFAVELLRGDELGQFNTPFTTAQFVSLGLFATGLVYALWLSRRQPAA